MKHLTTGNLFPFQVNIGTIFDEFEKLVNQQYTQIPKYPPMDVYRNENKEHVIEIATTFKPENIDIDVEDNQITISGKNEEVESNDKNSYYHKTISKKSFIRTFTTDYLIDKENVEAIIENGLLKIILKAKQIEPVEKTKVQIKVNNQKQLETTKKDEE